MRVDTPVLHRFSMRAPVLAGLLGVAIVLSGCAQLRAPPAQAATTSGQTVQSTKLQKFLWVFSPYRPDIQQGNFVSREMLALLAVGQSKDQVQFIMGTPLVRDVFHADRWDYPFYLQRGNGDLTSARVTVHFKDEKVARIEGGNLPSEQDYIAQIAGPPRKIKAQKDAPKKETVGAAAISINK